MAIAYAGGVVNNTKIGAAGANFIPTLWSSKVNKAFYAQTVFSEISNNDYAGEISGMGDKVTIPVSPTITIQDYTIGTTLSYERPVATSVELVIDRAKGFWYQVNDVEKYQAKVDYMNEFADAAGNQLKVAIDADVLQSIYLDPSADNEGNTAGRLSNNIALGAAGGTNGSNALKVVAGAANAGEVNAYDLILRLAATLDEQNVPESDRWLLIPPSFRTKLFQSGQGLALIQGGNESQYRNGKIGMIDRFNVYVTNQLKTVAEGTATLTYMMAGHKSALAWASQIATVENMPNPNDFGTLVRGLNVYGFKVIKPEALAAAVIY